MDGLGHSNTARHKCLPKKAKHNAVLAQGAAILTSDPTVAARWTALVIKVSGHAYASNAFKRRLGFSFSVII